MNGKGAGLRLGSGRGATISQQNGNEERGARYYDASIGDSLWREMPFLPPELTYLRTVAARSGG